MPEFNSELLLSLWPIGALVGFAALAISRLVRPRRRRGLSRFGVVLLLLSLPVGLWLEQAQWIHLIPGARVETFDFSHHYSAISRCGTERTNREQGRAALEPLLKRLHQRGYRTLLLNLETRLEETSIDASNLFLNNRCEATIVVKASVLLYGGP